MSKYFTYISLDGKCSNSCGNNDFIRTISFFPLNYVCTYRCNYDEFKYIDTNKKKYYLKQCPEAAKINGFIKSQIFTMNSAKYSKIIKEF